MRRNFVAGNWKMNGDLAFAAALCADIARAIAPAEAGGDSTVTESTAADSTTAADTAAIDIAVCPPHVLIPAAREALAKVPGAAVCLGAQDVDAGDNGAFTGQVSARMLADAGCRYVIVGHSERRALYFESDASAARKAVAALAHGLRPIVCVGESADERAAGRAEAVIGRQVDALLAALDDAPAVASAARAGLVIAYEPVWAIGSGLTATPQQAQAAHAFIRARLARFDAAMRACRILYGGSLKPANAAELMAEDDIDGGLIGGASLNAGDFVAICRAALQVGGGTVTAADTAAPAHR